MISRPQRFGSLVLRDTPNFLASTPSRGRPAPYRKISEQNWKNSTSRGKIEKASFQYGMKSSIEIVFFIPSPSLTAEKQGLGLKFSSENEHFKPSMRISSENGSFVHGGWGNDFFMRCEPSGPLQHSKMPRTPHLSKICPDNCFSRFQSGRPKFVKYLSKIWVPRIGTPKKTVVGTNF